MKGKRGTWASGTRVRQLRRMVYMAGLALCLLGACPEIGADPAGLNADQQARSTRTCAEPAQGAAWRAATLRLLNQERAAHDVPPLAHNAVLEDQANQYACEMIECDFVAHVNPCTGTTLRDRSIEFGYNGTIIGENLASGHESPAEAVSAWMASTAGHREAILDVRFTEVGVGIRAGGADGLYWALEFGRPQQFVAACLVPPDADAWADELIDLINAERSARGLAPLALNAALEAQAGEFTCELIDYAFFSHCNPSTGVTLGQRASTAGYDYLLIGESIARGYATPAEVFEHWLTGSSDYENILEPRFVDIGIAVRTHGGYQVYCVAVFGQPR